MKYKFLFFLGVYMFGLIVWVINGYYFDKDKLEILMFIYKIYCFFMEVVWVLLNKKIEYIIEDEVVIFEV